MKARMTAPTRDEIALIEDLQFLADCHVGATEAATRTGFPSTEALEKWLQRRHHHDLWMTFVHHEPIALRDTGKGRPKPQRRQMEHAS